MPGRRPYDSDMGRYGTRADMIVHEEQPFNAESALAALTESLTATDAFYVRGPGGGKVTDAAVLVEIERALVHELST